MICIMCSLDSEYSSLIKHFQGGDKKQIYEDCYISEGKAGEILVKSRVGKESAARCAKYVLKNNNNVTAILSVGIAGALTKELSIGDIVYSDRLVWLEAGKIGINRANSIPHPLLERLEEYDQSMKFGEQSLRVKQGTILSGDIIVQDIETAGRLYKDYQVVCAEMESMGIMEVCNRNNISFLAVKTISDYADQHAMIYMLRMQNKVMQNLSMLLYRVTALQ